MNPQTQQQVMGALGYNMALPQSVVPVTKVQTQVSRTQYDPNKLRAVMDALGAKRATVPQASPYESLAAALGAMETPKSYTGGFGEVIENPYANAIAAFAKGWGNAYGARKANERAYAQSQIDAQNAAREDAIKAAQIDLEASKQAITNQTSQDYLKVNDPSAKGGDAQKEQLQRDAALTALRDLNALAESGEITALNKSTKNWALAESSSKNIGKREQALSALLPLTNSIARASGGSGINTIGEMLAYLGVPENATSAQIRGALPGLINKLGFAPEEVYQMSMNNGGGLAF